MNKKYVAMIPARLGSQRIPKKNIRFLGGKPLIKYPIDFCLECDFLTVYGSIPKAKSLEKRLKPKRYISTEDRLSLLQIQRQTVTLHISSSRSMIVTMLLW